MRYSNSDLCAMVTSNASSTPVQSMEIFLPSRSRSSTHPVSMLKWQALASYFIIASSKSCYWLTVYDKVSEFYAVHGSLHSQTRRKRKIRTLLQSEIGSDFSCLVGAGGFEPPKLKAADLQSVPIGHSGTRPYSFLQSFGLPVYVTTESAICQPIIWAGRKKRRNKGRDHKSPPARVRFTASGREGFSA